MSTNTQTPDDEGPTGEEQDLLDIADSDLASAEHARAVLREKFDYREEELP